MGAVILFLTEMSVEVWAAVVAVVSFVLGGIGWFFGLFKKDTPVTLAEETVEALKKPAPEAGPELNVVDFIRIRRELKADLEAELAAATDEEKDQLHARIGELENQISNPDEALAEARKRIKDLEALLDRSGNQIGADRIAEARAALEKGDYSEADALFEEIEARRQLEVEEAARAAFGRGEIAEAEVRWADAAAHFARAAKLHETFASLFKAREFA